MTIAAYIRVSSIGQSYEMQRDEILSACPSVKARELKSEGKSTRYIARCLGVPLATVFRCVSA